MFQRLTHRAAHHALLIAVGACLFLVNLGGASLWDVDEGRNGTCSIEMYESGNWIIPTFNGVLRSHKPALLYWLQAWAYSVCGVNEFAARLPSALAALLTLLIVYELGRLLFGAAAGLLASLILASTAMFCASAHFANPDALLNLFVALTLFLFCRGYVHGTRGWFVTAGAAAGLAMLAKGPSGLVIPAAVVVLFLAWSRRLTLLLDRRLLLGLLTFVLVAMPWYIWVGVDTKWQFLREFLLTHNLERALTPMENHRGPAWYYLAVLLVGFAPWSVFLGLAVWYGGWSAVARPWPLLRASWQRRADAGAAPGAAALPDAYRFLWCWAGVYLLTFTLITTKLPNYILPMYAPVALLTARALDRWRRGDVALPRGLFGLCLACLGLVGVLTVVGLLLAGGVLRMSFMRERYVQGVGIWALAGAAPILGAAGAWWCARRQRRGGAIVTVTASALLFLAPLAAWGCAALNRHKAPRPLVEQCGALRRDQEIRVGGFQLEYLPSLNFYCQRNVTHLENEQDVSDFLRTPLPVYLFTPELDWRRVADKIRVPHRVMARHRDMYHACDVLVVTNR
jgi:4-amino-4-deoxy-L-arabinose transferase-like glycosyltransferase